MTIGKNVKSIGAGAFCGCGRLKTIKIQSAKLTKLSKQALSGTSKKLVVKVIRKKKKAYETLLKKAGNRRITVK